MRRSEREVVGLDNVLEILGRCEVLRLGLCAGDRPYIVPMNFAYEAVDGQVFIYLHCASEGRKLDMIARNSFVCFEADCSYKIKKADAACGWSAEYESVIGEGEVCVLTDEGQKIKAMDALMKRYGFPGKPEYKAETLARVTALRILVSSITGKRNLNKQ